MRPAALMGQASQHRRARDSVPPASNQDCDVPSSADVLVEGRPPGTRKTHHEARADERGPEFGDQAVAFSARFRWPAHNTLEASLETAACTKDGVGQRVHRGRARTVQTAGPSDLAGFAPARAGPLQKVR
jgi:hypothetical protein